jgi:uncharacterized protein YuzB (UPF0349 family)
MNGESRMRLFSKKRKTPKLELCTNNLNLFFDDGDIDLLEELIDEKKLIVKEMDCLDYCDECTCSPHALLNSTYLHAENSEELIFIFKEKIAK